MVMDTSRIDKIKQAVKANFDQSAAMYEAFEEKHDFFRQLNAVLVSRMGLPDGSSILDVGCGTGASSVQIFEEVAGSTVTGLDVSNAMLEAARSRAGQRIGLSFVEGDASRLKSYFTGSFDAAIYSASIFLIPDYKESLRQARELLKPGGAVGLTFMDGVYDEDSSNLLAFADSDGKLGLNLRKPVDIRQFQEFFAEIFPGCQSWVEDFRLPLGALVEFFSVQAMSAGLFPSLAYEERRVRVALLFGKIHRQDALFRWMIMVGKSG